MKVLWPITERVCLSFTSKSTVHASRDSAMTVANTPGPKKVNRRTVRTLCNVDAFVIAHAHTDGEYALVASWPPPRDYRCPSCDEAAGTVGKHRTGSSHWQGLTGDDPRVIG